MLDSVNGRLSALGLFPVPDNTPFDRADIQQVMGLFRSPLAVILDIGTVLPHRRYSLTVNGRDGNIKISNRKGTIRINGKNLDVSVGQ